MTNLLKMTTCLLCFLFAVAAYAQKGSAVTPSYFNVDLGDEIYGLVQPNGTFENIAGNFTESLGVSDFIDGEDASVLAGLKQGDPAGYFYGITQQKLVALVKNTFKEKLDVELKPMGTLNGKIRYSGPYPDVISFKKVLKNAPGEAYYLHFSLSMFKGGMGVGPANMSVGGKLKPTTTITVKIANEKGKVIQEFDIKHKTDIVLGTTKSSVGDVEIGDGEDPDEVSAKVIEITTNALNEFVEEYLKKNKKDYK